MRILCIVYFDSTRQTGHVAHARGILSALNRKHTVHVIAPGWDAPSSGSMRVTHVWQWKRGGFYTLSYVITALPRVIMEFIKNRPDVVYARYFNFLFVLAIVSRLFRVPMVVEHNADTQAEHKIYRRGRVSRVFNDIAERSLLAFSSGSVAVTESIVQSWRNRGLLKNMKTVVIRNGVDADIYRPLSRQVCRSELGLDDSLSYICYVGSFADVQGLRFLLEAFKLLLVKTPRVGLLLVGAEPEDLASPLMTQAKRELDHRLVLVEAVPGPLAAKYICAGDVCVAPYTKGVALSQSATEAGDPMKGDPLKVYAYMACARPVVASHFREAGQQITEIGAGLAVAPEDPRALCDALGFLLNSPTMSAEMGARGRSYVEAHATWDIVAERTVQFIRTVQSDK